MMKNINRICLLICMLCCTISALYAQHSISKQNLPDHPRILLLKGEEDEVKRLIKKDYRFKKIHQVIMSESNKMINTPALERKLIGRRLLDVSRKALKNIFFLSYSYRITGNEKYAVQAEKELVSVCQFIDWNPSHFLDVAEMTMAVAIGYDWLYNTLSSKNREIIKKAIIEKGIKLSYDTKYNGFLNSASNWNQVCNAGICFGAMAIAESDQDLTRKTIERAINNPRMMKVYEPDGVYSEGPVYWNYGTSFNVMLLTMLEKIYQTDFGLSDSHGFKKTPVYLQQMYAPDKRYFNYSDCQSKAGLNTTLLYFAQKQKDNSLLWSQKDFMEDKKYTNFGGNRLLPASMIWGINLIDKKITPPESNFFIGEGHTPIAVMRSSWNNKNTLYLGVKLGKPASSHGHMDIGSFVFVTNQHRWAMDFGPQDYESLESKGIDLWNRTQKSDRWKVFRYNNMAHNTLTFNNQLQRASGMGTIEKYGNNSDMKFVISNLTDVYKGQVEEIKRGYAMVENNYVIVRDEIIANNASTRVRWNMLTPATIEKKSDHEAILKQKDGTKLLLRIDSPANTQICTWSTKSTNSYDSPNKNTIFIGFEYDIQAGEKVSLQVSLIPISTINGKRKLFMEELNKW